MLGFAGTRNWVYPQSIDGMYQRRRRLTFVLLHLVLFGTPWLIVDGNPALLIDLPGRKLFAFGAIFTPHDTILVLLLALFLAFSLFFFTSLYGRVWCGYGCPQTVLLDTWIRPLERRIEGDRTTRIRRDAGRWTFDKIWRKATKWTLFATAAIVLSMAFMSYFAGARALWTGQASAASYALVAIFAAGWFADFAWFREQFCNFLCPYARFQSALTDDETIQVSYNAARGEPRGGAAARDSGRCISCSKCVNVCPNGIDIRNGFQLECIACARCVDACTSVMDKLGHESLVTYTSIAIARGRKPRRVRPRTVAYASLLGTIATAAIILLVTRVPFEAAVARAPGSLFTVDDDGWVRNTYLLRVTNNAADTSAVTYRVRVDGMPREAQIVAPDVTLRSNESATVPLVVRIRAKDADERTIPLQVRVASPHERVVLEATFKSNGEGRRHHDESDDE